MNQKSNHGFTLLSLVVTVTIVVILAAAVYVWIDPVARIGAAKNTKRRNDVLGIASALTDYMKDNKGALPLLGGVGTTTKKVLCSTNTSLTCGSDTDGCLIIDSDTNFTTKYLLELPIDPDKTTQADTGYYLQKSSTTDLLIVGSCDTYGSSTITYSPPIKVSCNGYAAGYCWYITDNTIESCDTFCSNNGMTCVDNVDYGSDTNCELNQEFSNGCDSGCNMPPGADVPPGNHGTTDVCFYQTSAISCEDSQALYLGLCPCQ